MNNHHHPFKIKLIVIGDMDCGKTSICAQYLSGFFDPDMKSTVGVEFNSKKITIKEKLKISKQDTIDVDLQVWDLSGNKNFENITDKYFHDAMGAFIVYDVTNRESFENINKWINKIKHIVNCQVMLVGNKIDLFYKRQVLYEEGLQFAKKNGYYFEEISAKDNTNINKIFEVMSFVITHSNSISQPLLNAHTFKSTLIHTQNQIQKQNLIPISISTKKRFCAII